MLGRCNLFVPVLRAFQRLDIFLTMYGGTSRDHARRVSMASSSTISRLVTAAVVP